MRVFDAKGLAAFGEQIAYALLGALSGAVMLFFSYFSFYPVYYIVSGSLLLVMCAAAAIFGKRAK